MQDLALSSFLILINFESYTYTYYKVKVLGSWCNASVIGSDIDTNDK